MTIRSQLRAHRVGVVAVVALILVAALGALWWDHHSQHRAQPVVASSPVTLVDANETVTLSVQLAGDNAGAFVLSVDNGTESYTGVVAPQTSGHDLHLVGETDVRVEHSDNREPGDSRITIDCTIDPSTHHADLTATTPDGPVSLHTPDPDRSAASQEVARVQQALHAGDADQLAARAAPELLAGRDPAQLADALRTTIKPLQAAELTGTGVIDFQPNGAIVYRQPIQLTAADGTRTNGSIELVLHKGQWQYLGDTTSS